MKQFKGILTPIITPFNEDGSFYEQGMVNLIEFLHKNGVNGVYAIGSYGSFPLLHVDERKAVAEVVVRETKKRGMQSIIQVGAPATRDAVELAQHAEKIQADAVASVVPFYYSNYAYNDDIYLEHFKTLIDSVDNIPVQMYNNPKTTGYTVTVGMLEKLMDLGLTGLKDSSANISLFSEMMNLVNRKNPDFDLMPGSASIFLSGFMLGAEACVAGTAMAFPELVKPLYDEIQKGNYSQASAEQLKVVEARVYQSINPLRAAVSYDILRIKGVDVGVSRKPWYRLNKDEYNTLYNNMKEAGFIC